MPEVGEASWAEVEGRLPPYGSLNARRVAPDVDFFLAVDHEGYRHALLLLVNGERAFGDDRSRGLLVRGRDLEVEGEPARPFLDVVCTDRGGHEAFNLVASEMLRHLAAGEGPTIAVKNTLARWRRFWGIGAREGLTREELVGLFGELWFMLVWLLPHGIGNLENWVGPSGARHDFQWERFSVEVKTTESLRGHIHRINGLDQLDPPESGTLYLFSLRVREEPGSANSVVTLVERLGDALADEPALMGLLEERLAQVGYSPVHAERYSQTRFRIIGERLYRVGEGFPRLSADSFRYGVPRGVERVEYEINPETVPELCVATTAAEMVPEEL